MAVESFNPSGPAPVRRPRDGRRSVAVVDQLQREIMLGLLPPGAGLRELDLAARFSCSQGTVREALLRLQEDGLVIRVTHRGTHVCDNRAVDARELIRLRHDIECRAVPRIVEKFDAATREALAGLIDAMRAAAAADDEYLLSLHDRAFHLRLHQTADMPTIQPILQRCLTQNHRYKILNSSGRRALEETAERHGAIIEALDARDPAALGAALSHHITTIVDLGPSIIAPDAGPVPGGQA